MKMMKAGKRLLASSSVLAMVFCALAVLAMADDAVPAAPPKDKPLGFSDPMAMSDDVNVGDLDEDVVFVVQVNDPDIGSVDHDRLSVPYGGSITINGQTLTTGNDSVTAIPNEGNAQYTCIFVEWIGVPNYPITENTGNITAVFQSIPVKYTITWKDYDESVLNTSLVEYGQTPQYPGGTPTREPTQQLTYEFSGWNPGIVPVEGDATYTATYIEQTRTYTVNVTVNNPNMGHIEGDAIFEVGYGTPITTEFNALILGQQGTSAMPNQGTGHSEFSFVRWDFSGGIEDGKVVGDVTATAVFREALNKYTVTIIVQDPSTGSVDPTSIPEVPYGTPVDLSQNPLNLGGTAVTPTPAQDTVESTFSFERWEYGEGFENGKVVADAKLKAVFKTTPRTYTVTFVSNNTDWGSVRVTQLSNTGGIVVPGAEVVVHYGTAIVPGVDTVRLLMYTATAITKDRTDEFTYSFRGWSENASGTVTGNMTIQANFEAERNRYPVIVTLNDDSMGTAAFHLRGDIVGSGYDVEFGEPVKLSISPGDGYTFISLKHNGQSIDLNSEYEFDVGVVNNFEVGFIRTADLQFTVTLDCGENGSITPNDGGEYVMMWGSSTNFQVSSDFGYKIKTVKLDGIDQEFGKIFAAVAINNIDADHTIGVEFEMASTYPVQLIGPFNGEVEITGLDADGMAVEGRTITIMATPNPGFYTYRFLVNGEEIPAGDVPESRTISVDDFASDGGKIVIEVQFVFSAIADEDDVPVSSKPSAPKTGADDGVVAVVAASVACLTLIIIALYMDLWRKT